MIDIVILQLMKPRRKRTRSLRYIMTMIRSSSPHHDMIMIIMIAFMMIMILVIQTIVIINIFATNIYKYLHLYHSYKQLNHHYNHLDHHYLDLRNIPLVPWASTSGHRQALLRASPGHLWKRERLQVGLIWMNERLDGRFWRMDRWIDTWTDTDYIIITQSSLPSGFNAKVIDLEDFNADILIHSTERAIFLMATYGEGINHTSCHTIPLLSWCLYMFIPYHHHHVKHHYPHQHLDCNLLSSSSHLRTYMTAP